MGRIEKTVFVSYRRTNFPWALAIFQDLTQHGFDVFIDYTGINSGDFGGVIVENIKGRAHFIVLLTPSALEGCGEPGDWLRREIETALEEGCNIIPIMLENFDFGAPGVGSQLTGDLEALKRYNGLRVMPEYFREGMDRLRDKYLNVPLDAVMRPPSAAAQQAAEREQSAAASAPIVARTELANPAPQTRLRTWHLEWRAILALIFVTAVLVGGWSLLLRWQTAGNRGTSDTSKGELTTSPAAMPTLAFQASKTTLSPGESTQLSWSARNADKVHIDPGIGDFFSVKGSLIVRPAKSVTYRASAAGPGGVASQEVSVVVAVNPPPPPPNPLSISIPANRPWTPTGIVVSEGQLVTIKADGEIIVSDHNPPQTPNGTGKACYPNPEIHYWHFPAQNLSCSSLIGRIGDLTPFEVGSSRQFRAESSGPLWLGVNDNWFPDNRGSWEATIFVKGDNSQ